MRRSTSPERIRVLALTVGSQRWWAAKMRACSLTFTGRNTQTLGRALTSEAVRLRQLSHAERNSVKAAYNHARPQSHGLGSALNLSDAAS